MKKWMKILKFGSPTIELILDSNEIIPGEKITGSFHLQGGLRKQKVARLECDLVQKKEGEKPKVIEPVKTILMSSTLSLKEKSEFPFHFRLTKELRPTSDTTSYQLRTKLVYQDGSKSTDHDDIVIMDRENSGERNFYSS